MPRFSVSTSFIALCLLAALACGRARAQESAKSTTGGPAELPALAVLVHAEPGGEALGDPLRALLEAETTNRYEGAMLERAELATLLQEMKLSALLGGVAKAETSMQTGKMNKAACLVVVRVSAKEVRVTVTGFPKTDILIEKTYTERLEAESLAGRIAGDALGAVRSRSRDTKTPYVSIGSFYCLDPHRRFFDFSRAAEADLRKQLGAEEGVRLMERMFPSDLLNEFNLTRGGMTVSKVTDFNAPPADLLIYAECTPQQNQDLNNPGILLDCAIKVISPTDLIASRTATASCRSNDIAPLIAKSKAMLLEAVAEARGKLAAGGVRGFSMQEFESFKKQAFRLMPSPPLEGGIFYRQQSYRGPGQSGPREELERALRMLECTSLFSGSDTAVLDCTAAVLYGLASYSGKQSPAVKSALLAAATELTERAYHIESNWNTRSFFVNHGLGDQRPEVVLKTARHILNSKDKEPWHRHEIDNAFERLLVLEPDWERRRIAFLEGAPAYEKRPDGVRSLFVVVQHLMGRMGGDKAIPEEIVGLDRFATGLITSDDPLLQAYGHFLGTEVAIARHKNKKDAAYAEAFFAHYQACLELFPKLSQLYKQEFAQSNFSHMLGSSLTGQANFLALYGMGDGLRKIKEQYVVEILTSGDATRSNVSNVIRQLVPEWKDKHQEARAIEILKGFLARYDAGGSGDYDRMEFTRALRLFQATVAKPDDRPLTLDRLRQIQFDDGKDGLITRLVALRHSVFGVRSQRSGNEMLGKAFRLSTGDTKADFLNQVKAEAVRDVAATEHYLAVGTHKEGIFLLNAENLEARQLTPANSALPGATVYLVGDAGSDFLLGIPDKDNILTLVYRLNPAAGQITATDAKIAGNQANMEWGIKAGANKTTVAPQSWDSRTTTLDGKLLTLNVKPSRSPSMDVSVTTEDGQNLFQYQGIELTYVFDFMVWHGHLVFATGNGLYVAKPGSNELRLILCDSDLLFLSARAVDDQLYLGTSRGLYAMDTRLFTTAIAGPS